MSPFKCSDRPLDLPLVFLTDEKNDIYKETYHRYRTKFCTYAKRAFRLKKRLIIDS